MRENQTYQQSYVYTFLCAEHTISQQQPTINKHKHTLHLKATGLHPNGHISVPLPFHSE